MLKSSRILYLQAIALEKTSSTKQITEAVLEFRFKTEQLTSTKVNFSIARTLRN